MQIRAKPGTHFPKCSHPIQDAILECYNPASHLLALKLGTRYPLAKSFSTSYRSKTPDKN
jgi:hypothetical protein